MNRFTLENKPDNENKGTLRKSSILQFIWLLPTLSVLVAVLIILTSGLPFNKLHTIQDAFYVQQLSRQAMPETLTLLDPVWGSVIIEQPEKVLACYDFLTSLPFTESGEKGIGRIRDRELSGTINFLDRASIHFSIYDSVVVDGIAYGDANTKLKASFLIRDLYDALYTPENLSRLIDRYTRIVLRMDSGRINLSTNVKKQLQKEISSCEIIKDNNRLSELLQGRGRAVCQIEIYTNDVRPGENGSRQSPQIYIAVYGNGLLIVYDVDISVGSDMHLFGELNSVFSMLE